MNKKKWISALLAGALMTGLAGCAQFKPTEEVPSTEFSSTEASSEINTETEISYEVNSDTDIHLRDKNLLYENQDNTEIVTMYLTVSTGNSAEGTDHTWEEINTYSAYDYEEMGVARYKVAGLLQVGDENGPVAGELGYNQLSSNCTVQIRGQSSSKGAQKNYKIKLKDNKGEWRGQTTIALNKHQTEGLRFRNKMAFDMLADIDELMSLRTTFVHLYVRDTTSGSNAMFEDYGIYTQVEQLNKTALSRHGLDKNGHLYKVNYCEFFRYEDSIVLKDDPNYDLNKFEQILEVKGDDDHSKLIDLLEKINDYSIPIETILEEHLDIENVTYWMAFNILVGNIDTQSRNFYLYSPQNSDRWYIYPWDIDAMLRRTEYEILERMDYEEWESGVSNYWGNVLFQRCLKSEYFREELDLAMQDLFSRFDETYINSYVDTYAALLKPYVYSGKDLIYAPLTEEEYDIVAKNLASEISDNYQRYQQSLQKPMPFYIGVPQKTAKGYTVQWDAAFDFDREDITYTFALSQDYTFQTTLYQNDTLTIPTVDFQKLPEGQYFMRVTATNTSGYTQTAFDYYRAENDKIYGTKCFYIDEKGNVVEDLYAED